MLWCKNTTIVYCNPNININTEEDNFYNNKKEQNEQNKEIFCNQEEILNNENITIEKKEQNKINENENENELKEEDNKLNEDINVEEKEKIQNNEIAIKNNNKTNNNIELNNNNYEDDELEKKIKDEVSSVSLSDESDENNIDKKQNNEFFDLLLNFVMNNKQELNYVLTGYFTNAIMALLKINPTKTLNYLYKIRKDALKKIIFRSQLRAFSILASKLLNLEKYDDFMKSVIFFEKAVNHRNKLIVELVKSLCLEGFKDEYDNLYINCNIESRILFITTLIDENIKIAEYILEKNDIYGHILNLLNINLYNEKMDDNFNNKYNNYISLIKLINKLLKSINSLEFYDYPKEFYPNCAKKEKSQLSFNDYMIICFSNILKNNFIPKKPTLFLEKNSNLAYKGLGILNLEIIELTKNMFTFMKKIPNKLDLILINNNFCQNSFHYFFEYQWNNIYHLQFVELFGIYLKEEIEHRELTKFFFEKYKLHEVLIHYLQPSNENNKMYFKYKSGNKAKSGIYPHVVNLIYKLQVTSGLNTLKDEEKTKLNILNIGEFEFLKDENSNKNKNRFNISWRIGTILKESNDWKRIIEKTIIPLIKKYEGKLGKGIIQLKTNDAQEVLDTGNLINIVDNNNKSLKDKNRKKHKLNIDELCFMNKGDNTLSDKKQLMFKNRIEEVKHFGRIHDDELMKKKKKKDMDEFFKQKMRNNNRK